MSSSNGAAAPTLKDKFAAFINKDKDNEPAPTGKFFAKIFNKSEQQAKASQPRPPTGSNPAQSPPANSTSTTTTGAYVPSTISGASGLDSRGKPQLSNPLTSKNGASEKSYELEPVKIMLSTSATPSNLAHHDPVTHISTIYASGHPYTVSGMFQWYRVPHQDSSARILPIALSERPSFVPSIDDIGSLIGVQWIPPPTSHAMPSVMSTIGPIIVDKAVRDQALATLYHPGTDKPIGNDWSMTLDAIVVSAEASKLSSITIPPVNDGKKNSSDYQTSKASSQTVNASSFMNALSHQSASQQQECTLSITRETLAVTLFQDAAPSVVVVHASLIVSSQGSRQCIILDTSTSQYISIALVSTALRDRLIILLQHLAQEQAQGTLIGLDVTDDSLLSPATNELRATMDKSDLMDDGLTPSSHNINAASKEELDTADPDAADMSLPTPNISTPLSPNMGQISTANGATPSGLVSSLRSENSRLQARVTRSIRQETRLREQYEAISAEKNILLDQKSEIESTLTKSVVELQIQVDRLKSENAHFSTTNANSVVLTKSAMEMLLQESEQLQQLRATVAASTQELAQLREENMEKTNAERTHRDEIDALRMSLKTMTDLCEREKTKSKIFEESKSISEEHVIRLEALFKDLEENLIPTEGDEVTMKLDDLFDTELRTPEDESVSEPQAAKKAEKSKKKPVVEKDDSGSKSASSGDEPSLLASSLEASASEDADNENGEPEEQQTKGNSEHTRRTQLKNHLVVLRLKKKIEYLESQLESLNVQTTKRIQETTDNFQAKHAESLLAVEQSIRRQEAEKFDALQQKYDIASKSLQSQEALVQKVQENSQKYVECEAKRLQLEAELQAQTAQVALLKELNTQWEDRLIKSESEMAILLKRNEKLQSGLQETQHALSSQLNPVDEVQEKLERESLNEELESLREQVTSLTTTASEAEETNVSLQQTISSLQASIAEATETIQRLKEDVAIANSATATMAAKASDLAMELSSQKSSSSPRPSMHENASSDYSQQYDQDADASNGEFVSIETHETVMTEMRYYKRRAESLTQAMEKLLREQKVNVEAIQETNHSQVDTPSSAGSATPAGNRASTNFRFGDETPRRGQNELDELPQMNLKPLVDELTQKNEVLMDEKDRLEDSLRAHARALEAEKARSALLSETSKLLQGTKNSSLGQLQNQYVDLKHLANVLTDELNDKGIALDHMRRANKMLGTRVFELEKKLKTTTASQTTENTTSTSVPSSSSTPVFSARDSTGDENSLSVDLSAE